MKWYHRLGLGIAAIWLAERLVQLYEYFSNPMYQALWRTMWNWAKFVDPLATAIQALFAPALLILLILIHAK